MSFERESPHTGDTRPIGVLDSGVGGLSVLRHLQSLLPNERLIYFADQAHIPYGARSLDEIRAFSLEIVRYLLSREAKLIVVACNTASGAALDLLRERNPGVPIVGMEPAVKPAALRTASGKVGVLATPGTFNSGRYAALLGRYAQGIEVYEDPCRGLVEQIEIGDLDGPATEAILRAAALPMVEKGVDTIVLGCTHYPFVAPLLQSIIGDAVVIIDPAPAVARHSRNVLEQNQLLNPETETGTLSLLTSGDPIRFAAQVSRLLGRAQTAHVVSWHGGRLMDAVDPSTGDATIDR